LPRRQDRPRGRESGRRGAARSQGGGRARAYAGRTDGLSRSLPHLHRLSHSADGRARQARLHARTQSARGHRIIRSAAEVPDDAGKSPAQKPRVERRHTRILRHTVREPLHLGRHRRYRAQSLRAGLQRMIRPVATEIGLFLAPFILYAAFLVVTRTGVLQPKAWAPRRVAGLVIVSLVLMAGSFVVLAHFSGAPPGSTYVPAHVDGGKFVPGVTR